MRALNNALIFLYNRLKFILINYIINLEEKYDRIDKKRTNKNI